MVFIYIFTTMDMKFNVCGNVLIWVIMKIDNSNMAIMNDIGLFIVKLGYYPIKPHEN